MVINQVITIAFKCPFCGSVEFNTVSIFDFSGKKEYTVQCSCKDGFVKIAKGKNKRYTVSMPCIACNEVHDYVLDYKTLWLNDIFVLKCPDSKLELCFIGKDDNVRKSVDRYEMQMDILMNEIGYDDYFINNTVMLNTVDKIHDIAEKGNLLCQCGSDDISMEMFYDRVELTCNRCLVQTVIKACTNHDLKDTLTKDSIVLSDDYYGKLNTKKQTKKIFGYYGKKQPMDY